MSMVILPLSLIAIPIAEVLFSAFSRLRSEPERMAALWLDSIGYLAAVLLPLLLGLMVVSPDLIPRGLRVALGGLGRRRADPQRRRDDPRRSSPGAPCTWTPSAGRR